MRTRPHVAAAAWMILGLLAARTASSQTIPDTVDKVDRPVQPRIFHVPTAWLQPHGAVFGVAGLSHLLEPFVGVTAGIGGIAEVDVQVTDSSKKVAIPTALFKTGVAAGRLGRWQPALALAFRKSFAVPAQELTPGTPPVAVRTAQLSLASSLSAGPVDLHAGVDLWDAAMGATKLHDARISNRVRPFVGLEWRPRIYPRTTVLADLSFAPQFTPPDEVELRWVAAAGIRYQALSWGAVELAVRFRQDEKLDEAAVFVRLSAFLLD